ncbi:PIG-L family deacetylase [Actinoplanes sp. NPDC049599]|uniref:PIG-L family deacetylase n=1 Tax=Actinoplanes sp. NPDC049599 TaxID=3363903 RepID=UPI0037BCE869
MTALEPVRAPRSPAPPGDTDELRSGSRWLLLSTVAAGALNYGYALVLLRLLQAADYATFAAGQALLLAVGAMAQCAVPWVLAHELASARSDRLRRRAAVSFALLANTVAGLAGALVAAGVAGRFASGPARLVIAGSVVAIFVSNTTIGWLQGERRFGLLATVVVAEVVVKIVVGVGLIAAGFGGAGALAGFGAGALSAVLFGVVCMRHDLRPVLALEQLRRSLRTTVAMTSMQGLLAAQANLDVLLVAVLPLPLDEAAGYQAAAVLGRVPVFVSTGLSLVMFPLLTESRDRAGVLRRAMSWYAAIAAVVLAVLCTAPAELVAIVIPVRFTGSAALLPLLAVVGMAVGVVGLITAYLQALQRYRTAIPVQVGGLLVSAAAIAAGWRVGGPAGVAVGAALAAAGTAIVLQVLAHGSGRRWNPVPLRSLVLPAALAAVLLPLRAYPKAWLVAAVAAGCCCGYLLLRARRPARAAGAGERAAAEPVASFPGPYLFVSPHLDDCVLSCGALLTALRDTRQVTVATLFTAAAPGPVSLSARSYLRQCGARDAQALYRARREEDRKVLTELGVEVVHLGLTEALFRRPERMTSARRLAARWWPELGLTYPTYRLHVITGRPSRRDAAVVRRAADEIMALVAARRPATVFLPLGLGGHVDHLIARSVGERCPGLAVYYADFPYATRHAADPEFVRRHHLVAVERHEGVAGKQRLIRGYRSQFTALFPDGAVPSLPERYFVPPRVPDGVNPP